MGQSKPRRARRTVRLSAWLIPTAVVVLAVAVGSLTVAALTRETPSSGVPTGPRPTASQPTEQPADPRATLDDVRALIATSTPLTINVLGDSTGNDGNEWVALWARHLADTGATVALHSWDTATNSYREPSVIGDGARQIDIWNGSIPGQNANAALDHIDALQPTAPSLLILNYGHNRGTTPVGAALNKLTTSTDSRWSIHVPVVVMLQNPAAEPHAAVSKAGRDSAAAWATESAIPTVDVTSAFTQNPNWTTDYLIDGVHPNPAGSAVWFDTVVAALG